jgi:hypothetical protein
VLEADRAQRAARIVRHARQQVRALIRVEFG